MVMVMVMVVVVVILVVVVVEAVVVKAVVVAVVIAVCVGVALPRVVIAACVGVALPELLMRDALTDGRVGGRSEPRAGLFFYTDGHSSRRQKTRTPPFPADRNRLQTPCCPGAHARGRRRLRPSERQGDHGQEGRRRHHPGGQSGGRCC